MSDRCYHLLSQNMFGGQKHKMSFFLCFLLFLFLCFIFGLLTVILIPCKWLLFLTFGSECSIRILLIWFLFHFLFTLLVRMRSWCQLRVFVCLALFHMDKRILWTKFVRIMSFLVMMRLSGAHPAFCFLPIDVTLEESTRVR